MFSYSNFIPIKGFIRQDVLYDMNPNKINNYLKCLIIGINSYPGHVPTFQIIVDDTSIFSYIPPHLLLSTISSLSKKDTFSLKELVYHNCPDEKFSINRLDYLIDYPSLSVYLKDRQIWRTAKYLFTMDWYAGNDLLHCLILQNGQFGFFPNHKISLGERKLSSYCKLHQEWKV